MKILLSFSGGYDSTYILYKLLTETEHSITAVFFCGSHPDIAMAVPVKPDEPNMTQLIAELRKIRDFEFIVKEYSREEFTGEQDHILNGYLLTRKRLEFPLISGPMNYLVWYAAPGINEGKYDTVVNGITWEQLRKKYKNTADVNGSPKHEQANLKLKSYAPNGKLWLPLLEHDFHDQFNRWHVFKYLPKQYARYCLSCANPFYDREENIITGCGYCFKCLWDKVVISLMDHADYSASQIEEYRMNKAIEYGGGDGITAPPNLWLPVEMKAEKSYSRVELDGESIVLDSKEKVCDYMQRKNFDYLVK